MQTAWLRDAANGKYLLKYPASFVRVPAMSEYIWVGTTTYIVAAVSHTWDPETNEATAVLDISVAAAQAGMQLRVTGKPVPVPATAVPKM